MPAAAERKRIVRTYLTVILCGVLYTCFVKTTGLGIPCLFHVITGLKCPGCGISRMFLCLLAGDVDGAFAANPFLLATSPFLLFEIAYVTAKRWQGKKPAKRNDTVLAVYTAALILFGILRNICDL